MKTKLVILSRDTIVLVVSFFISFGIATGGLNTQSSERYIREIASPDQPDSLKKLKASGSLIIGFGKADITPDWPVVLSYGNDVPVTEYYDRPDVKVVLFRVEDVQVAWLEFSVIGIRENDADFIKETVEKKTGMPAGQIIVAATHNHSYPRTYDERVRDFLAEKAAEAVQSALANQFEARIGIGKKMIREDLNWNRAELNGKTNALLYLVCIEDSHGNLRGIVYNYGSHPVIFTIWSGTGQIGGEWPGYVNHYIEMKLGSELMFDRYLNKNNIDVNPFVMFSEGAAGDQEPRLVNPWLNGGKAPVKKVFMDLLAEEIIGFVGDVKTTDKVDLGFRSKPIILKQKDGQKRESLLQALIINNTVIATIPGELGVDLARRFERESPMENNLLVTVANDYIGYIVPEHLAYEEVTYQSKGVIFEPHYGEQIIDEALRLIDPAHKPSPLIDPATAFGKISGKIYYSGKNAIAVGVRRVPAYPNYAGGFWGKRTVVAKDGTWSIDGLAPGELFVYVVECDPKNPQPTKMKSDYKDIRFLVIGYPVTVKPMEETSNINFSFPKDYAITHVKSINLINDSLCFENNTLKGTLRIDGTATGNEQIMAGVYPSGLTYRNYGIFMMNPVIRTAVSADGTFVFESLPPGKYQVGAWLDVNRNNILESGIDVYTSILDSPVLEVKPAKGDYIPIFDSKK